MKELLILFCFMGIFLACNEAPTKQEPGVVAEAPTDSMHHHDDKNEMPRLNNGAKWKADENTNKNIQELKRTLDRFAESKTKDRNGYTTFANELQGSLNTMIKECRMKGADHDALHQWLEPLLKDVNELKTVQTAPDGAKLFASINSRVIAYNQYFE